MCSWCYGFANELSKVVSYYTDRLDFEMVMGGLRPYNTQTMSELKSFLGHHWHQVAERSGQRFNHDILDDAKMKYDTEPPSRATVVVRSLTSQGELAFFTKVQEAFYADNLDLNIAKSYHGILEELGIDTAVFDRAFHSDHARSMVKNDFNQAVQLGARSFPTLILQKSHQLYLVAPGYMPSDDVIVRIEKVLSDSDI